MKTLKLTLVFILLATTSFAQSLKYTETMEVSIADLYQAESLESFDPIINKFSRIGQAEKTQWEPYYYASLANVFKSFRIKEVDVKDKVLDQALSYLKKADELSTNNVEIVLLQGFANMIKISVDPATRGQSLSPGIMASFGKALGMEPSNPRANLFMGQMKIGMAGFFGTGIEEPCEMIQRSIQLFDIYESASSIAPAWGKPNALQYQESCMAQMNENEDN